MPAVTSVTNFSDGNVLTASALNAVNCGIHVYSNAAARDAAYGGTGERTLVEGEYAYLLDTNSTQFYDGSSWLGLGGKLGQVLSTSKTDTFSTSSATYTDVTGLSVSITPTLATSKVLVIVNLQASVSADISVMFQLVRGSTAIDIGDTAGSRTRASFALLQDNTTLQQGNLALNFLDSPATTSATTYKMQMFVNSGTGYINRTGSDADSLGRPRTASNITVMEVLA